MLVRPRRDWKERASARCQDAKNIAIELHQLLKQAGEKEPFVLVAASVARFYARQYVDAFPVEVASLVLVDSSTPEQIAEIPGSEYSPELIKRKYREVRLELWREANGWALVSGGSNQRLSRASTLIPILLAPGHVDARMPGVGAERPISFGILGEAARARCCNDLPLLIISQDPHDPRSSQPALIRPIWNSLQERLRALSPHSHRIIARGSGHAVMIDRPDVVIRGVQQISAAASARHRLGLCNLSRVAERRRDGRL